MKYNYLLLFAAYSIFQYFLIIFYLLQNNPLVSESTTSFLCPMNDRATVTQSPPKQLLVEINQGSKDALDVVEPSVLIGPNPPSSLTPLQITIWTKYFSDPPSAALNNWLSPERLPGPKDYLQCSLPCLISFNREDVNESQAVVFHSTNVKKEDVPPRSRQDQIWVYMHEETPLGLNWDMLERQHEFNWTMTYRWDSDVPRPYGHVLPIPRSERDHEGHATRMAHIRASLLSKKVKIAGWTSRICHSPSGRQQLVQIFKQFFPVTVMGGCGRGFSGCAGSWPDGCLSELEEEHKFVFAFENGLCKDYVTEKFFRALQHNLVPIVYGAAEYEKIAPPNSYIDVANFSSPTEAAQFVLRLAQNDEEYLRYFEWKRDFKVVSGGRAWCTLCHKLWNRERGKRKWYKNIWKWETFLESGDTIHEGRERKGKRGTRLTPVCKSPPVFDEILANLTI